MSDVQIQIDAADAKKRLQALKNIKDGAPKATMRAFNRTLTGMKTDAGKGISESYTIPQRFIKGSDKKGIQSKLSLKKASMSDLSISMSAKDRGIRSTYFSFKPNEDPGEKGAPSVRVQYKKGSGFKSTGGFIATMPGEKGVTGAFARTGVFHTAKKGRYIGKRREKFEMLHGPGAVQMLNNEEVRTTIQDNATERFNKELDHQIKYLLDQQKG